MRYSIAMVAVLGLTACTPAETEADADVAAAEEPVEEVAAVEPGGVAAGSYTVTGEDGEGPFTIDADGNWTSVNEDGEPEAGTSEVVDGKICFTIEGETEAECWTNDPANADGSFTSTSDEGATVTVRPAEG